MKKERKNLPSPLTWSLLPKPFLRIEKINIQQTEKSSNWKNVNNKNNSQNSTSTKVLLDRLIPVEKKRLKPSRLIKRVE